MSARPPFTGADANPRPSHQQPLPIPTAATAFSTAGCAPPPAELAPNEQWRAHLASTFASLQLRFQRAMDAWKARQSEAAASADIESNLSCPGLPTTNDPDAWFAYCYRPRQTNSAASNDAPPLPQAADPLKPSAPTSTVAASLMQVAPGIAQAVFRMEQVRRGC
ncbi:hypothetical protein H4R35_007668 [Dimargaris xerosporica]|nr:hypothetical protein H4R35_007668 [Dimargaris xerosporica]